MTGTPRLSANGFYCARCGKWTYQGYDSRDAHTLRELGAVCVECFRETEGMK